ncbi:MAG TPA: hypothetical protein VGM78_04845, partial [Ilumatobacteraceae bacterium]
RILASPTTPRIIARRRPKRRTIAITGGLVTAMLATAAYTFLSSGSSQSPLQVGCHETAELSSTQVIESQSGDPVTACQPLWTNGEFGTGNPPELHACVGPQGGALVFPGDLNVCDQLGLSRLNASDPEDLKVVDLSNLLLAAFRETCVGEQQAVQIVTGDLAQLGLTGWTVHVDQTYGPDRPCTASEAAASTKTVTLGGRLDIPPTITQP